MQTVITTGVSYAQFLEDQRAIIRQEVDRALGTTKTTPEDENGGMELAVEVLDLAPPTIYALVSKRQIPHSKRGNRLYFNRTELLNWIAAGKRNTATN